MKLKFMTLRLLVVTLLVAGIAVFQTAYVGAATCERASGNGDSNVSFGPVTVEAGTVITVVMTTTTDDGTSIQLSIDGTPVVQSLSFTTPHSVSHTVAVGGSLTALLNWQFTGEPENSYVLVISCPSDSGPLATNLLDGRINNDQSKDVAAPVAIYPGSIQVYGINPETSEGNLVFIISDEQIESVGVPTENNVLLAEGVITATGMPVRVFRLTSGEYLLMTHYVNGTAYNFIWDDDGNSYHVP